MNTILKDFKGFILSKYKTVVFLDTVDRFLERTFSDFELIKEFENKKSPSYLIRIIKIKKIDYDIVKTEIENIYNKALICGYTDFNDTHEYVKSKLFSIEHKL